MLWVVFALMTGVAVLCVLWPLGRSRRRRARAQADVAFYRMQLAEVERDSARELLAPGEVEGARTEVARRLLAASAEVPEAPAEKGASRQNRPRRLAAAGVALVVIPLVTLGLYARLGSPNEPDEPLLARFNLPPDKAEAALAILRAETYAENLVLANNGTVTPEASKLFQAVLRIAPQAPKSRFYMAIAAEQAGDKASAIAMLSQLVADSPPDAPWLDMVKAHIADLGGAAPPPSEAAAIASLPPEAQQAAIRGMVDKLAAQLAQDGHDAEGWLRLVRSYVVLKESDKARGALADARRSLASDAEALARLDALGRELGLGGS
jgi:cytochrome c-type biogenesis protein CcmH